MEEFWKQKSLSEMETAEWESLCDGCARCCLQKLEHEDSSLISYTHIACRYLDQNDCKCTKYQNRHQLVPQCVWLKPEDLKEFHWLPSSCAYRLLYEGKDLHWWHPLVSGRPETVVEAGISVSGKVISEEYIHEDEWQEHIINWVD